MFKRFCLLLLFCFVSACSSQQKTPTSQHLRLNILTEPPTLDFRKASDITSINVIQMLFEGLTRIDENQVPSPAVAETITISEDGREYTFTLREAQWSNGDPLTSEDFIYSWQTTLDPKYPSLLTDKLYVIENASEIKAGKLPIDALGVEMIDEKTFKVRLQHPASYFLELLAFPTYFPVNKKNDLANPEWAGEAGPQFVTNGPFQLKKWDHENEIIVEKCPLYWDADNVVLESMHLSMIDDLTTEHYMYEMNELDWSGLPLSGYSPDIISQLIEQGVAKYYDAMAVYYYKINTDIFPLNNINIRKALALAINREEIVEHVTQAQQIPAFSVVPPMAEWGCSHQLFDDHDIIKAKECFQKGLEELDLQPEDFPKLTLSYNTSREHQKIAQAIQQQWLEALGVKLELEHCDWKVYLSKINKQDYQIARSGWMGDFSDPITFLNNFKYKDDPDFGGQNETGWEHPDFITYLEKANYELDSQKRIELLKKAEALIISEMPVIPIYYIKCWYQQKPYVQGVLISPTGMADFKRASIQQ